MRRSFAKLLFGAFALAAPLFIANTASADCAWLDAGNGTISCELDVTGGCEARCTPVTFRAQCGFGCEGECGVQIDAQCHSSCQADCSVHCTPGSFDCKGYCETDCSTGCETRCVAGSGHAACVTQCRSNCSTTCESHCAYNPPTCAEQCDLSCQGSCSASIDAQCQFDCQGGCTSQLTGGCQADCQALEGALFCNGYYVEADDVVACFNNFSLDIDCNANGCVAEASCSTAQVGDAPLDFAALGAMVLGVGVIVTRRRNAKK